MKMLILAASLFAFGIAQAQEKMKFNFPNEEIVKIIDVYAKATNTKMVIDSTVRGNITILNPSEITHEEALNQLGEALMINGFSINKRDDYYVIRNARSAQRDALEVSTSLPSLKPQRMATWIVSLKNIPAAEVQSNLGRIMNSSYGEMTYNRKSNQIIVSDFTSALHRINSILLEFDRTEDPRMNKLAEESRRVEEKNKAAAAAAAAASAKQSTPVPSTSSSEDSEKVTDMEIKLKKAPAAKPAADAKPVPEASAKKDN